MRVGPSTGARPRGVVHITHVEKGFPFRKQPPAQAFVAARAFGEDAISVDAGKVKLRAAIQAAHRKATRPTGQSCMAGGAGC